MGRRGQPDSQRARAKRLGISQRQMGRIDRGELRTKMAKAVVLLSGGMDSTLVLYEAIERHGAGEVVALGIDYQQRHDIELDRAEKIATSAGVKFTRIGVRLPGVFSALLKTDTIGDAGPTDAFAAVVPGRNSMFALLAAMHAMARDAREIWMGCCAADALAFPDCRPEWVQAMSGVLNVGVCRGLRLVTPLIDRTKAQIVSRAHDLGPECWHAIGSSWSCYDPKDREMGDLKARGPWVTCCKCSACKARAQGFAEAGHEDPGAW